MLTLLITLPVLAAVLALLVRTIVEDGYGARPLPRSHREEEDVDAWGFPLRRVGRLP